ncbi:hypothetical protein DEJ49_23270 [Streptomyces venezuelae]|uniref:Uncharacterized protein n=1 Tax=Streptomyces venezuelae TaxID=54571 RepID=A0A5P2CMG5_STRVZ|nr:hypothetical protein [Streptomyces venezuelae]QES43510.1 hypothetical protein DEJ49_23270 [Streptomyces venezuelae]
MRGHIERGPFLLALLAALALAGCLSSIGPGGAGAGTALAEDGAQSSGTVGNEHARVGDIWYLALPAPHNTSARSIEITRVAVDHVPAGIELLGFGAYDLDDTEGLPLLTKKNGAHTPDFEKLRNYATKPVKVKVAE